MRKPRNDLEHIEQVKLFNWARQNESMYLHLSLLFAIPNGGHRHIGTARKLKAEGVKAGVPDCFLAVPKDEKHGDTQNAYEAQIRELNRQVYNLYQRIEVLVKENNELSQLRKSEYKSKS